MKTYKPRIADKELQRKLAGIGAVLIEGPKWCGKTTTAEQQAASIIYMDAPLYKEQNLRMADINPKALLVGESPILVDEWQLAPKLWATIYIISYYTNIQNVICKYNSGIYNLVPY